MQGAADGPALQIRNQLVRLNERAARLLACCDGTRDAQALAREAGGGDEGLEFIAVALELGWIVAGG